MSTLSLRLPESLHKQVKALAKEEGVSVNSFITTALAEKLSALLTREYLGARAARAARAARGGVRAGACPGSGHRTRIARRSLIQR